MVLGAICLFARRSASLRILCADQRSGAARVFETYRENIDERYWLPTYTYADEVLNFEKGFSVHMRMVVRYKNYRRFSSDVKVTTVTDEPEEKKKPEKPEEKPIRKP